MKAKTLRNGITKIVFEAVIAVAVMVSFVALNSKKVQAKTYNSGETAYVEDIKDGDIINKGVIITSKSDSPIGFSIDFYNGTFGFDVNVEPWEGYIDTFNNTDMNHSWEVGTIPKKAGGTKPSDWDEAWPLQVRTNNPDIPGISYDKGNYYIYFDQPQSQPQTHEHNFYKYSAVEDYIYAHCKNDDGHCTLGEARPGEGYNHTTFVKINFTVEDENLYLDGVTTNRFNKATNKSVSENDLEYYKVNTEGETTGGTKLARKPTEVGNYYAILTLTGVPDGDGNTTNVTARQAFWYTKPKETSNPEPETKDDKKEENKENVQKETEVSSAPSSSPSVHVPVLTKEQQAKITEEAQAVVGSTAYKEKLEEVRQSITKASLALSSLISAQQSEAKKAGVPLNFGGCTTIDKTTAVLLATNNKVPYNVSFTWNGLSFVLKIPAGKDITSLLDENGNLPMWKLVQKYGIVSANLIKK